MIQEKNKDYSAPALKVCDFRTEKVMAELGLSQDLPFQPFRAIRVITE
ncbi:MAG: hypothetical protein IJC84_04950 [Clostridia bacterium]|nr:hypothetical protein [Clostridia bacterium]